MDKRRFIENEQKFWNMVRHSKFDLTNDTMLCTIYPSIFNNGELDDEEGLANNMYDILDYLEDVVDFCRETLSKVAANRLNDFNNGLRKRTPGRHDFNTPSAVSEKIEEFEQKIHSLRNYVDKSCESIDHDPNMIMDWAHHLVIVPDIEQVIEGDYQEGTKLHLIVQCLSKFQVYRVRETTAPISIVRFDPMGGCPKFERNTEFGPALNFIPVVDDGPVIVVTPSTFIGEDQPRKVMNGEDITSIHKFAHCCKFYDIHFDEVRKSYIPEDGWFGKCKECGCLFLVTRYHIDYLRDKGYNFPRRCFDCRIKRRT